LIIKASPDDYLNLVEIIKELDKRPKQVFVEAMIMEVSINKALNAGTKWRTTGGGDRPVVIGGVGEVDSSTIDDIFTGLAGLTVGGITNFITVPITQSDGTVIDMSVPGLAWLFTLEMFKDVINVLSTPHILTSNNKEAEIIVGENVPFLSQFERETGSDQAVLQSIEREDVGITLRITPQISDGGYVKLDIYQEISAVAPTALVGGAEASDIITTKRSAKTSVVVKDGQRIVIGGLIQEKKSMNETKVPLLGDIPVLGYLFKFKSDKKERTNLIVFLTPIIVDDFDDLNRIRREREKVFSQAMNLENEVMPEVITKKEKNKNFWNQSLEADEDIF
jgi:general secretion pathway protein D